MRDPNGNCCVNSSCFHQTIKWCFILGRHYTVSIALPGSILDNAQTPELRTYLAGQVKMQQISILSALTFCLIIAVLKVKLHGTDVGCIMYMLQIARAAVVFNVDEIVIFDEAGELSKYVF